MNLGHAHITRLWYLLEVFSKFSDEHPRHFYRGVPPGYRLVPIEGVSLNSTLLSTSYHQCTLKFQKSKYYLNTLYKNNYATILI